MPARKRLRKPSTKRCATGSRTCARRITFSAAFSARIDYAAVGPEHSYLRDLKRIEYAYATDDEALEAFQFCARVEGIIPALESAHAVAYVMKHAKKLGEKAIVIVNLSGRGDKD